MGVFEYGESESAVGENEKWLLVRQNWHDTCVMTQNPKMAL